MKEFDKYDYYTRAVQSPENDVEFFFQVVKDLQKKSPKTMREDFCGTFVLSRAWVEKNKNHRAVGLDLDREPIEYGVQKLQEASAEVKKRLSILNQNVLDPHVPSADLIVAMNFSHYVFKERQQMLEYFKNCRRKIHKGGLFIIDCFGGSNSYEPNEEITKHKNFTYYWDQMSYDPVTNFAKFHIHFKLQGEKKRKKVFSYDWRLWSIPELKDLLLEAGFKKTHVYWEGTTKSGEGNGKFRRISKGEYCESWIAYIAAE